LIFPGDLADAILAQMESVTIFSADESFIRGVRGAARVLLINFGCIEGVEHLSLFSDKENVIDGSYKPVGPLELPGR